jgi:ABC-type uncharacterized transport system substrate-binding protein
MFAQIKPFVLPLVLIALISAVLLGMDAPTSRPASGPRQVALIQFSSTAAADDGVRGIVEGLAAKGYVDGQQMRLKQFNAQGDLPTANDIARQVTSGGYDLIITATTLSMQSVANANRLTKVPHVFGIVTDAATAGIGVSATDPLDHPAWLTGYVSLVPVKPALELARRMNPELRRVGLVWHSAEVSSQMYTRDARETVKTLGMELLEATAESASEVGQAAASLVSRGAETILVTGDVVVLTGLDPLVKAARQGGIPVISLIPPSFRKGALFDLGTDYSRAGRDVGELAGAVLSGAPPAKQPIENKVPLTFNLNLVALEGLRPGWRMPEGLVAEANVVIDRDGERRKDTSGAAAAPAAPAAAPGANATTAPTNR